MVNSFLKPLAFCSICLAVLSCGVKKDPEPLPLPRFDLYRIGSYVYLVPREGEIVAEGFEKRDSYLVRREEGSFCFRVKRRGGRELMRCVAEAVLSVPEVEVRVEPEGVRLLTPRGRRFRLYPYRDRPIPPPMREFSGELLLGREPEERVYALTEVLGSVESAPLTVRVPPAEPPEPPPPRDVRYTVRGERLYLYWWAEEGAEGFLIYRDGRLLTERPIRSHVFVDDLPEGEVVYEIVSVNRFGKKSKPAVLRYRP